MSKCVIIGRCGSQYRRGHTNMEKRKINNWGWVEIEGTGMYS